MQEHEAQIARFTPTCVGTIMANDEEITELAVHPHMRGDNLRHDAGRSHRAVHPHMRGDNV